MDRIKAGTTALRKPMEDMGYRFKYVINYLGGPAPQLPSLEVTLDGPVDDFIEKVGSQHYFVTYGDNTGAIQDLCKLLDIEII